MRQIPLTQGKYALVDDDDFDWLNQWKWSFSGTRYAWRGKGVNRILMHRLILNPAQGFFTDHKNGNGLDNRKSNLRIASLSQNQWNYSIPKSNTSGFKGVSWYKKTKRWQAQIKKYSKSIHIGYFKTRIQAAKAYNLKAKELFGEFALIN